MGVVSISSFSLSSWSSFVLSDAKIASTDAVKLSESVAVKELGGICGIESVIVGKDGFGSCGSVGFLIVGLPNMADSLGEADGTASLVGLFVGFLDGREPGGGQVFFQILFALLKETQNKN